MYMIKSAAQSFCAMQKFFTQSFPCHLKVSPVKQHSSHGSDSLHLSMSKNQNIKPPLTLL